MAYCKPQDGGCWYCHDNNNTKNDLLFSHEFDTYIHMGCIQNRKEIKIYDPELEMFLKEFGLI